MFTWVHIDTIFITAPSIEAVHQALISAFRRLHEFGFNISVKKSHLVPCKQLRYCGLRIDFRSCTYEVGHTHSWYIKKLLFLDNRTSPQALSYWLYSVHLTAAVRHLVATRPDDVAWRLLNSGPWPLLRPPKHFLSTDASPEWLAVVDGRASPIFMVSAPRAHIYHLEMLALLFLCFLAPPHSCVGVDNQAVVGSLRRSKHGSRLLRSRWLSLASGGQ